MTPYKDPDAKRRALEAQADRLLDEVSEANRPFLESFVRRRRASLEPGSISNNLQALVRADHLLGGKRFHDAKPEDWELVLEAVRTTPTKRGKRPAATSLKQFSIHVSTALKDLYDVDRLPRSLRKSVWVRNAEPELEGNVIEPETWKSWLEVAEDHGPYSLSHRPVSDISTLHYYKKCGWRNDEGCSPNIGDVHPLPQRHCYDIALNPTTGCRLKTGPRTITVYDPQMTVWLEEHPAAGDPHAPLRIGLQDKTGYERLTPSGVRRIVTRCAELSGSNAALTTGDHYTPHDLRHTCATEKVLVDDWDEILLRPYFGWTDESTMPARYVHLKRHHHRERVLRDAGVNALGLPVAQGTAMTPEAMMALGMKAMLEKMARDGFQAGGPAMDR